MTVICCWRDDRFGPRKLTALADSRLSSKAERDTRLTQTDDAVKLFALRVRCYFLGPNPDRDGVYADPYLTDSIGVGFTGNALEGYTVVELLRRALNTLVYDLAGDTACEPPMPAPNRLVAIASDLVEMFMAQHALSADLSLRLLIFGWGYDDGKAWIGEVAWRKANKKKGETKGKLEAPTIQLVDDAAVFSVGSDYGLTRAAGDSRKKRSRVSAGSDEADVEAAIRDLQLSQLVEDAVLEVMTDPDRTSVGGTLTKLELIHRPGGSVVAWSQGHDINLLNKLPAASADGRLQFAPTLERIGT